MVLPKIDQISELLFVRHLWESLLYSCSFMSHNKKERTDYFPEKNTAETARMLPSSSHLAGTSYRYRISVSSRYSTDEICIRLDMQFILFSPEGPSVWVALTLRMMPFLAYRWTRVKRGQRKLSPTPGHLLFHVWLLACALETKVSRCRTRKGNVLASPFLTAGEDERWKLNLYIVIWQQRSITMGLQHLTPQKAIVKVGFHGHLATAHPAPHVGTGMVWSHAACGDTHSDLAGFSGFQC